MVVPCRCMKKPSLDKPPQDPENVDAQAVPPIALVDPPRGEGPVKPEFSPFGLSDEQVVRVRKNMWAMARKACRHSGVSPEDAVQQAWFTALSKPEEEWRSIQNEKQFVSLMCTLVAFEVKTIRQTNVRRRRQDVKAIADTTKTPATVDPREALEARDIVARVISTMKKARDRELACALFLEEKAIVEVAREQKLSQNTVSKHKKRLWKLIWARIQALVVALWLLVPKKARAFVANVSQQLPQLASTMAVTGVCGVLAPTGSSFATETSTLVGLTQVDSKQTNLAEAAVSPASFVPEVVPEELKTLDAGTNTCSPGDMKSTQLSSILQETVVPLALVVATGVTQAACAGSNPQTPPTQQPAEEPDGSHDPYDMYCTRERARGLTCVPREEF